MPILKCAYDLQCPFEKRLAKLERNVCGSNTAENPDSPLSLDPDEVNLGHPDGYNVTQPVLVYRNAGPLHNYLPDSPDGESWRSDICLFGHMLS